VLSLLIDSYLGLLVAKNYCNISQSSAATTRHANVGRGGMGQTQAAWKLINIHIQALAVCSLVGCSRRKVKVS